MKKKMVPNDWNCQHCENINGNLKKLKILCCENINIKALIEVCNNNCDDCKCMLECLAGCICKNY